MCQKIAIAQAFLAWPGLPVLDEAWTGLDQSARGALDAAVAERLSEGATVVFVDHDLARLTGRVDERWRLTGGTVAVAASGDATGDATGGSAAGGAVAGGAVAASADGSAAPAGEGMLIEVTGLVPASLAQLATLPGVLAALPDAADKVGGPVRLTVRVAASDDVLRQLLSWDGVHVRAVRTEPEAGT
jgi:ABC-2 type transport system ATP-binding protein